MSSMFKKIEKKLHLFFIPSEENNYRPQSLTGRTFLVYLAISVGLKLGIMSFLTALPDTFFYADVTRIALIDLTNNDRAVKGLGTLKENTILDQAAEAKARDILSKGYFAHESPDGKTPWYWFMDAGYKYLYAGENLAIDFVESDDVVKAWLASPGHKANIENVNYRDIGIAVVRGKFGDTRDERTIVVQLFGKPVSTPVAKKVNLPTAQPSVPVSTPSISGNPSQISKTGSVTSGLPSATPFNEVAGVRTEKNPTTVVTTATKELAIKTLTPSEKNETIDTNSESSSGPAFVAQNPKSENVSGNNGLAQKNPIPALSPSPHAVAYDSKFYAKAMNVAEKFTENIFFVFLGFAIMCGFLNVFVNRKVLHPDLIARALVLSLFFLTLVLLRNQTFIYLLPAVQ